MSTRLQTKTTNPGTPPAHLWLIGEECISKTAKTDHSGGDTGGPVRLVKGVTPPLFLTDGVSNQWVGLASPSPRVRSAGTQATCAACMSLSVGGVFLSDSEVRDVQVTFKRTVHTKVKSCIFTSFLQHNFVGDFGFSGYTTFVTLNGGSVATPWLRLYPFLTSFEAPAGTMDKKIK